MPTKKVDQSAEEKQTLVKQGQKSYIHNVGRRKGAVARVRLHQGPFTWDGIEVSAGQVFVNKKPFEEYFKSETERLGYQEIFKTTNAGHKYSFTIVVAGGGKKGQLKASLHGMARSMVELDPKHRPVLKKKGLLTRDPRVRQRRKVGMGGKSRRKKQSPKR